MGWRVRMVGAGGFAALLWAAFYPGLSWLAWPALAGLFWVISGWGAKRGAAIGALAGFVFFTLTFTSVLQLRPFIGALAIPLWILLAAYAALYPAVFGAVVGRWPSPLAWAGAWTLLEMARATGPFGVAFGSLPGAMAVPPLVGAAGIGGPWLLSLAAAWTGACLAARTRGRRLWLALALLGPALLLLGSGVVPDTEQVGTLRVAVVQTGVPQEQRLDPGQVPEMMDRYRGLLEGLDEPLDLVVFPESVLPVPLRTRPEHLEEFKAAARRLNAELLVGTGDLWEGEVYNSTLLLDEQGEIVGLYDKMHLVPFGEYLPARDLWEGAGLDPLLQELLPRDLAHGSRGDPIGRYGVLICFESQFPALARRSVAQEAQLLVVPTNDAWFGDNRVLWDHFAFGALRAAEQGRAFIHATSTGVTGVFDPAGRLLEKLPLQEPGVLYVELPLRRGQTPYGVVGDWPVLGLAVLLVVVGVVWEERGRRSAF
ncbi:MAG: apolipoprotein N-acyltransferase [Candidatus Bipolaricaulota bacterium]